MKIKQYTIIEDSDWKSIPNHPGYVASRDGQIKSFKRYLSGKILTGHVDLDGYVIFSLTENGKTIHRKRSQLVALAWLGPRPQGLQVAHKNGQPHDDRVENLAYKTPLENTRDKYLHGTMRYGEQNQNAILTENQVIEIYQSNESNVAITKRLGINHDTTVACIRKGKSWFHLTQTLTRGNYEKAPQPKGKDRKKRKKNNYA